MSETNQDSVSLNKFISNTGLCSRRAADKLILAGRVKINGLVATKGNRVAKGDQVSIDDKILDHQPDLVFIAFNKPPGVTSTTDPKDRDNIIDFIGYPQRIFPIGRLDKASEGLIFLTNDGDIVNKILRAENQHEKEYIVRVNRLVSTTFVNKMSNGVPILGTVTKRCRVEKLSKFVFKIVLTQGLNRQIRRMCEYLGYKVVSLKRIRIMSISLDGIEKGYWRNLSTEELNKLYERVADSSKTSPGGRWIRY